MDFGSKCTGVQCNYVLPAPTTTLPLTAWQALRMKEECTKHYMLKTGAHTPLS